MKLKKEFIPHETGSESLLIPTGGAGFSGLVKGNKTLGVILGLLTEDTTEEKIIAAMKERFDAPEEVITADVQKVLSALCKIDALGE
ncbi:MAG: PqqD family protein [Oscillospiraceae bacterium]|nr:PqqD family protein [Oscillospiraceae bacterium]